MPGSKTFISQVLVKGSPNNQPGNPAARSMHSQARRGRYQTTRLVGSGGYGSVYEALDTKTNKRVAIKRGLANAGQDGDEDPGPDPDEVRPLPNPNAPPCMMSGSVHPFQVRTFAKATLGQDATARVGVHTQGPCVNACTRAPLLSRASRRAYYPYGGAFNLRDGPY